MPFSPRIGFFLFRFLIPALLLISQVVLYRVGIRWLKTSYPDAGWIRVVVRLLFIVFAAEAIYVILARPKLIEISGWYMAVFVYPFFLWYSSCIFLGLALGLVALVRAPFRLGRLIGRLISRANAVQPRRLAANRHDASRRAFVKGGVLGMTGIAFGGTAYGMFVDRVDHEITEAEFLIADLPPELSGTTIALVSDIHSSAFMRKPEMDTYVQLVNSLQPDIIVVDGDFVNSDVAEVYPFAESFSALRAPLGVFGVMGNHDFYSQDPEMVAREVDDCGIKLLRDEKVIVEKGGGRMYLIGVDDIGRREGSLIQLASAIGATPLPIPRILLCHRPYYLPMAAEHNIDLMLSGHTHGGQIVLARFGNVVIAPSALASKYVAGRYSFGRTQMYVSRGIGTVGLPVRINCPPEITKITLKGA